MSKVSQNRGQSVSKKPASQPEGNLRPQLSGKVASSKEVQVSQKTKQVENQPEVETVSQPETSQSAGSATAAQLAKNQPVSWKCPVDHN